MRDFHIWFAQQGVILESYSLLAVKEWEKLQEEKGQNFKRTSRYSTEPEEYLN